ncbi:unnamed protein product [Strongylus vulgaris]|uniref:Neurotransmitter-gated ion-channel ligand-binding domain-containing protein n=1 Tax=Strongylus vulgaris TaxID=40348 RepID=A0A3P7L0L1_STRVU|nr:unnamed protein product [Strongylus vulgaris]
MLKALINATGHVSFFVPTRTATVCAIDVEEFPFDKQDCLINMMTQSFAANEYEINIDLSPSLGENISAIQAMGNEEWQITNLWVQTVFHDVEEPFEMLGMALSNIMSLTFILGILATALPKTKGLPKIAIYVMVNLLVMVLALVATIILPYFKIYLMSSNKVTGKVNGKKKIEENKFYRVVEYGLVAVLELANLINFIVLIA